VNVSVLIPVRNKAGVIGRVLAALAPQLESGDEAVVLDDRSSDDSGAQVAAHPVRLLTRTGDPKPYRLASARNLLVREAANPELVFLAADCVPEPEFIAEHKRGLAVRTPRMMVAGRVWNPGYVGVRPEPLLSVDDKWRRVFSGNLSMSRRDFDMIGGFDENFDGAWGQEDVEFAYRAVRVYGYRILRIGAAAWHDPHPRCEPRCDRNYVYFRRKYNRCPGLRGTDGRGS